MMTRLGTSPSDGHTQQGTNHPVPVPCVLHRQLYPESEVALNPLKNKDNIQPQERRALVQRIDVAMRKDGKIDPSAKTSTGILKNPSRYQ